MGLDHSVLAEYQTRLQELTASLVSLASKQTEALFLLAIGLVLFFGLLLVPAARRVVPVWISPLSLPIVAIASRKRKQYGEQISAATRLTYFYERGVARLTGAWTETDTTGDDYTEAGNLYQSDLNVFGQGSLFQLLCTTRTEAGRQRLADYLLHPPHPSETAARQAAVRELHSQTKLREEMALLGDFEFSDCHPDTFTKWVRMPTKEIPSWLPVAALASSVAAVLLFFTALITSVASMDSWFTIAPWLGSLLVSQAIAGYVLRDWVMATLEQARTMAAEISILRQNTNLLAKQTYQSDKLQALVATIATAPGPLRKLEWITKMVLLRDKDQFWIVSLYVLGGTQLCMPLERWRLRHGGELLQWLDAWAEFEALNALAGYAYEHPQDVFPTFEEASPQLMASSLGHPLLSDEKSVRNDVALSGSKPLYIVSGSNMAGKSTLLRTIGLNVVLARAGAPVRAHSMTLAPLNVCASIATQDSLLEGKSRFQAEVERIRETLAAANRHETVLFLFDEIFSGTNSTDRRIAAEAVIRALLKTEAIGAITTHDLALTEIATLPGFHGENVHMAATSGDDPLDFDYLLRPGVNRQSNALAIARLAGVPV